MLKNNKNYVSKLGIMYHRPTKTKLLVMMMQL